MTITTVQKEVGRLCKGVIDVPQGQINECIRHTLGVIVRHVQKQGLNGYVDVCKLLAKAEARERKRVLKKGKPAIVETFSEGPKARRLRKQNLKTLAESLPIEEAVGESDDE